MTDVSEPEAIYPEDEITDDPADGMDEGEVVLTDGDKQVVMEPGDITIFQYKTWYDEGDLNLNPDWQRDYVWKGRRPSLFIESILMRLPIPVIFLAKTIDEKYEVIDGVQRLTTAFKFLNNEFRLSGLSVFSELNGKRFRDLTQPLQKQIRNSKITCFILSPYTSQDMLFTIFERINTGGIKLNEMEIRNCIFRGKLNDLIKSLSSDENFRRALNMSNLSDRMLDRSLVLRFLAFYERPYSAAQSGLKRFLNDFFETYRNPPETKLAEFEKKFKHAMRLSFHIFGEHAFRITRDSRKAGGIWAPKANAALFQVVATSLARLTFEEIVRNADSIHEEYLDQIGDQRFLDAVTKATGDYSNLKYAFESWNRRIEDILRENPVDRSEPRVFSRALKDELYRSDPTCSLCGQRINSIYDAAVDHIDQYWRGGRTIPENARLTHRTCNSKRSRSE